MSCCWVSVTAVFSAHSISECLQNQNVNGRCRLYTGMTRPTLLTRQRTASVPVPQASTSSVPAPQASTSSVPAPQASTSSVDLLTTQLTALQHQMEAMQDVVLGLASSIHSPPLGTPDFVDPAETSVTQPHAEPTITSAFDHHVSVGATLDSVGPSAQQNVSGEQQTFALPGNSSSFSSVPLGFGGCEAKS